MEALGNELELALVGAGEMTDSCYRAQELGRGGVLSAFFFSLVAQALSKRHRK